MFEGDHSHILRENALEYPLQDIFFFIKHPDLWEARGLTIIKYPGERSLKSCSKLLVVNSGNYYLDRLTAEVYEGNITYDVFNYINYNAIFIFNNVPNHEKMQ